MKRREFSLSVAASALIAGTLPLAGPAQAQARQFKHGRNFLRLTKPVASEAPAGKVEVVEFFWYSCPHCHAFEPTLSAWARTAPEEVSLRRVPVGFNDHYVPQQKLFYALEDMGKLAELHTRVFRAIHEERQFLDRDEQILAWVGKQGLNTARFKEFYDSFNVANLVRRATQLEDAYDVTGVPSMGVAGQYYIDGSMNGGSMQNVLQVVEYLVATVRGK